jgi:hypothetical protein
LDAQHATVLSAVLADADRDRPDLLVRGTFRGEVLLDGGPPREAEWVVEAGAAGRRWWVSVTDRYGGGGVQYGAGTPPTLGGLLEAAARLARSALLALVLLAPLAFAPT